jgi:hypothetical protein
MVLADLAPSCETVGSLLKTAWLAKPDRKNDSNKLTFKNFQTYFYKSENSTNMTITLSR